MKLPQCAIERAACGEEIRYALDGIWLDVERELLVATDGHVLAIARAEVEPHDVSGLLPKRAFQLAREMWRRLKKDERKRFGISLASLTRVVVRSRVREESFVIRRPVGQFPKWESALAKFQGKPTIVLDFEVLTKAVEAIRKPGMSSGYVALWISEGEKPSKQAVLIAPAMEPELDRFALVMPLRVGEDLKAEAVLQIAKGKAAQDSTSSPATGDAGEPAR